MSKRTPLAGLASLRKRFETPKKTKRVKEDDDDDDASPREDDEERAPASRKPTRRKRVRDDEDVDQILAKCAADSDSDVDVAPDDAEDHAVDDDAGVETDSESFAESDNEHAPKPVCDPQETNVMREIAKSMLRSKSEVPASFGTLETKQRARRLTSKSASPWSSPLRCASPSPPASPAKGSGYFKRK